MAKKRDHPLLLKLRKHIGETFWKRGISYRKKTSEIAIIDLGVTIQIDARVDGTRIYHSSIRRDKRNGDTDCYCSCPAFDSYGACKHLGGLACAIYEQSDYLKHYPISAKRKDRDVIEMTQEPLLKAERATPTSAKEQLHKSLSHAHPQEILSSLEKWVFDIKHDYYKEDASAALLCCWEHPKTQALMIHYCMDELFDIIDKHLGDDEQRKAIDQELRLRLMTQAGDDFLQSVDRLSSFSKTEENRSYSLRIFFERDRFSASLYEHKLGKNGRWSKGKKMKDSAIRKATFPPHLQGYRLTNNWDYYYPDCISFSQDAQGFLALLRQQETLSHAKNTTQYFSGYQEDCSFRFHFTQTDNEMIRVSGDLFCADGTKAIKNRKRSDTLYGPYDGLVAWTNQSDLLFFFNFPFGSDLLEFFWNEGILMTKDQFAALQKSEGFEQLLEVVDAEEDIWDNSAEDIPAQCIIRCAFDESFSELESSILLYYDVDRRQDIALDDFRYYFSPEKQSSFIKSLDGSYIRRNKKVEQKLIGHHQSFLDKHFERDEAGIYRKNMTGDLDKFFASLDAEVAAGMPVFYAQATKRISNKSVSVAVSVSSGIDWFDTEVSLALGEDAISESENIWDAISRGERFTTLKDGTTLFLQEKLLDARKQLEALGLDVKKKGAQRASQANASLMNSNNEISFALDQKAEELRAKCQSFTAIKKYKVSPNLQATLRPYQVDGYRWLRFLQDYGFAGILADDMGLGKTVQTIALLCSFYHKAAKKTAPSLVICPTSLSYNRYDECQKFAPELSVKLISSGKESLETKGNQVFILSYGLLVNKRKSGALDKKLFSMIILDESQHIKNPKSERAKAICSLHGQHRLALSGTPIENNLSELWSVFQFLMPGFLGKLNPFMKQWSKAEKKDLQLLSQKIKPFVLRRTKEEVLTELPEKQEEVLYLEMEAKQASLYQQLEKSFKKKILEQLEEEGMQGSRFQILSALLRLRQCCLSPSLLDIEGNRVVQSAKLRYLEENIEDMIHSGHSLLIFSQFTGFLSLIKDLLDDQSIAYSYLDGSVSAKKRKELVSDFNQGKTRVFVISLKAGGTGLNLVAADYVIHMDPWWNPAVEQQATDRAHRMGQKKTVFVKKLIIKNSIEEKILQLQEKKKGLIDDLFSGRFDGKLSESDVRFVFE